MYEDDKLVDNSIKALDKNQDEVVWENIKKDDITKYLPFEVNEQGEKVGQKVTLDGKTYDVIYNNPDWVDDGNVT